MAKAALDHLAWAWVNIGTSWEKVVGFIQWKINLDKQEYEEENCEWKYKDT